MRVLIHWLTTYASIVAIVATLGVAVLLSCCLWCTKCGCREKDDIFNRHEM